MIKVQLLQLFLLLLLVHFGFCLMRQKVLSDEKCSDKLLKIFSQYQNLSSNEEHGYQYHLNVKEKPLEYNSINDENQIVEYKSRIPYIIHDIVKFVFIFC